MLIALLPIILIYTTKKLRIKRTSPVLWCLLVLYIEFGVRVLFFLLWVVEAILQIEVEIIVIMKVPMGRRRTLKSSPLWSVVQWFGEYQRVTHRLGEPI